MMNVKKLQEDALAELLRLRGSVFPMTLPADEAMVIVAHVQLALRHPKNTGLAATVARKFCLDLVKFFEERDCPANAALIGLGFDPSYDQRDAGPISASPREAK